MAPLAAWSIFCCNVAPFAAKSLPSGVNAAWHDAGVAVAVGVAVGVGVGVGVEVDVEVDVGGGSGRVLRSTHAPNAHSAP